jgi:mono/diheme cytochrome c family protein
MFMARLFSQRAKLALCAAALAGGMIVPAWQAMAKATYETTPRAPEVVYRQVCGYCHGHNVAPLIRGRKLDAATVEYFVRHGNGAMPAFKPTEITNQELAALANWVSASSVDPKEHGK